MDICNTVVVGAAGRMGKTLTSLIIEDARFKLAGAVERPEALNFIKDLEKFGTVVGDNTAAVLEKISNAVIIDFSIPEGSLKTVDAAVKNKAAAVIGSTGFTAAETTKLRNAAAATPIFWSPNMSVGINALLKFLPELVKVLGPSYDLEISEIHHNRKADSPSGTAIRLAGCLAEARGLALEEVKKYCRDGIIGPREAKEIGVMALRGGDVVGDHTVYFLGPGERIEITHRAHSRETFAQGALRAALWIRSQAAGPLYGMADMLV